MSIKGFSIQCVVFVWQNKEWKIKSKQFITILLFYFYKVKEASLAHKRLCAVYGDKA